MAKDDGADMKRRMTQKQQAKKKWKTKDIFERFKDFEVPKDAKVTQEDLDYDIWKEAARGLKEKGIPEDSKRKLRAMFDESGKDKLRQIMNERAKESMGREIQEWPEWMQEKKKKKKKKS
jgi:hypothetical protein